MVGGIERSPVLDPANGRLDRRPQAEAAAPTRATRLRNPLLVVLPSVGDASAMRTPSDVFANVGYLIGLCRDFNRGPWTRSGGSAHCRWLPHGDAERVWTAVRFEEASVSEIRPAQVLTPVFR